MRPQRFRHTGPSATPVLLADADPIVRRVLCEALTDAGLSVLAQAHDDASAVEAVLEYRPAVALVDIALPSAGGVALVRELTSGPVDLHVILLASREDPAAALDGLRAGASGYLTKDMQLDAMARAVRAVVAGEPAISRHLVRALVDALREGGERARLRPVRSPLTSREWEVLDLLCEGYGTAAIAHRLVISPETVRSHVKRINRKLGVSTREEAVVAAGELRGISTADPGDLVRER